MKRFLSIFMLVCFALSLQAQSCYTDNRADGMKFMQKKQYERAIRSFKAAKGCPDRPQNNDLDKLIDQCSRLMNTKSGKDAGATQTPGHSVPTPPPPPIPFSVNDMTTDFSIDVPSTDQTNIFTVKSPDEYSVSSDTDWCVISEQNNDSFKNVISENPKPRPRSANLTATCKDEVIKVKIVQDARIPEWNPDGSTRKVSSPAAEMPALLNHMRENGKCRIGVLTSNRRGVAINGDCDIFMTEEVPVSFKDILNNIKKRGSRVNALALTGSDYYCVVWDGNKWDGKVSNDMKNRLNGYINNGETIMDISISDDANFIILTDRHVYASRKNDMDFIIDAEDKYGPSKSICITNYGISVVCEYGIAFRNIPENVAKALKASELRPDKFKFTDAGTYMSTKADGRCEYNIR